VHRHPLIPVGPVVVEPVAAAQVDDHLTAPG
jgi:hypothetical protein